MWRITVCRGERIYYDGWRDVQRRQERILEARCTCLGFRNVQGEFGWWNLLYGDFSGNFQDDCVGSIMGVDADQRELRAWHQREQSTPHRWRTYGRWGCVGARVDTMRAETSRRGAGPRARCM
jgi:hypothetical protein